ncbi:MAG TPA: amidohydrolase family protein [Acidimicrobiia bacterium]|nr:amidohydrolase family protein [Acidimicrobiia bacterium]
MTTTPMTHERLISADDHVDLGHDRVKRHLATRFHDDYDAGVAAFGATMTSTASIVANQQWREQQGLPPDPTVSMGSNRTHAAFGRAGHTDPEERLHDMDADGVDVSSSYCEVSAFRYLYLIEHGWREATRAFNSALREFASTDPRRLVVSYQIPIHDVDAAVDEVRWAASVGCKSLQLPVYPAELGLPDYWDRRYDPLFAAIQETELPICCHIGLNTQLDDLARRDPTPQKGIFVPMVGLSTAEALGMWIMGGVFARFPRLKVVFVEPGLGWVSWWLYIVDDMVTRQGYEFPAISELPSHYFHQNVFLTFIDEPDAIHHARERLGIGNIMWSSDYPHPVSSWPNSRAIVDRMFDGVPAAERELVVSGNAARVWKL